MDEKWVRIMADYSSDGLWHLDGSMMDRDDLPLSAVLAERHRAWCERYENHEDWHLTGAPINLVDFAREGLEIAMLIKAELPAWTVVYFDENLALASDPSRPRAEYEYKVRLRQGGTKAMKETTTRYSEAYSAFEVAHKDMPTTKLAQYNIRLYQTWAHCGPASEETLRGYKDASEAMLKARRASIVREG